MISRWSTSLRRGIISEGEVFREKTRSNSFKGNGDRISINDPSILFPLLSGLAHEGLMPWGIRLFLEGFFGERRVSIEMKPSVKAKDRK